MRTFFLTITFFLSSSVLIAQDAITFFNEGLTLKASKDYRNAIEKFIRAVQLKPDYADALYETGWCQNELADYKNAIQTFQKVRAIWTTVPKVFFETAYAFEKLEKYDSAIYYYKDCLRLKPDYAGAYKQLGTIAFKEGNDDALLNYFSQYESLRKEPITDYLYWYRKGFAQNAKKDYEAAKISLNKSLLYKNDYINTYLELAYASSRLKQDDDAIKYYSKAIEIDPKSHIAYNGIGEVYRDNKKDIPQAMEWYNKTLKLNSNERKANYGMGYCMNSTNKYSEAVTYLKKAIQAEPTYIAAYVELGYSYYMIKDDLQAEANLIKALELNSKNENARYYLGLLYISQNKKVKAQQMANELKVLNSKNAAPLQEKINQMN